MKVVHIQLVIDLSTSAFVATFRRFAARRELPTTLYSDNGTNFKGFNRFLVEHEEEIRISLHGEGITWNFITPRVPNQGGFWESDIKSANYHLIKSIGNRACTFEEYATLFT